MFNVIESIRAFVADEFGFLLYLYGVIMIAMGIDLLTGVAKSRKGAVNSTAGKDGLLKKVSILLVLLLFFFVSFILPDNIGSAANVSVWLSFLGFELVSITENLYAMGLPIGPLKKFLKVANLELEDKKEVEDVKPKVD